MKLYIVVCKQKDYNQYNAERVFKDKQRAESFIKHNHTLRSYEEYELYEVEAKE